jgi:hypothetical protein
VSSNGHVEPRGVHKIFIRERRNFFAGMKLFANLMMLAKRRRRVCRAPKRRGVAAIAALLRRADFC